MLTWLQTIGLSCRSKLHSMPDQVLGERMCAFVIPRPGMTPSLEDISRFLLGKGIAKYKLPERLELVDNFPLSNVGKVSKLALTQLIAEKLATTQKE
jgi:2,3-dihydroxybenzoate---[aryl-carrier protein] ligase